MILIILALIAINYAFGENGLVKYADKAKLDAEMDSTKERLELVLGSAYTEKKTSNKYESEEDFLNNYLEEYVYEREPDANIESEGEDGDTISLNGYVFELDRSIPQLGDYIGPEGNLPPKIRSIKRVETSNPYSELSIEVTSARAEGGAYKYSIKKEGEEYSSSVEGGNTYTFTNLESQVKYWIKVELVMNGETVDTKEEPMILGLLETGNLNFGDITWGSGKASITVSTTTSIQIQYRIIPNEGDATGWTNISNNGSIPNIPNGATVSARLWDGKNGSEEISRTIVDEIPPVIIKLEELETTVNTIKVKVEVADNESGLAKIEYSKDNGQSYTTGTNQTEKEYEFTELEQGIEYVIKVRVTDNANNAIEKSINITTKVEQIAKDTVLPSVPKLSDGMTPVRWSESTQKWVKTTIDNWYNYGEKKWANVVLGDAQWNGNTLDESQPYSMLVWIPRYAYQITTNYHTNSSDGGNIDIVFIDTDNQNKEGTTTYSESYPSATTGGGMSDYVVHPAFNYGGTKLSGFWVGKYETSNTDEATVNDVNRIVMIKAGVVSWDSIRVSNVYYVCTNMNNSGNPYGLNTSDSVVDPHMMKNSEWGAVAYLSKNTTYGKGSQLWINPNYYKITGQAGTGVSVGGTPSTYPYNNTTYGVQASTTGNTTGIYDMSGGRADAVAAYANNGKSDLITYGSALVNAPDRYKDVYSVGDYDGSQNNYNLSTPSNGHYGDAVYETSSSSSSWYSDTSIFPNSNGPFFQRGGRYNVDSDGGLFYFSRDNGKDLYSNSSFRVVVPVLRYKGK